MGPCAGGGRVGQLFLGPGPYGPRQDLPGKIYQARCHRPNMCSIGEKYAALAKQMQHWRKICSIYEKYAALATNIQHWRNICKLLCFFTCLLKTIVTTEAKSLDHHQVPRLPTGRTPKLNPGQAAPELNRVKKHRWSPSSIRSLGKR